MLFHYFKYAWIYSRCLMFGNNHCCNSANMLGTKMQVVHVLMCSLSFYEMNRNHAVTRAFTYNCCGLVSSVLKHDITSWYSSSSLSCSFYFIIDWNFFVGRIRMFNKPEPKGEKLPIPDISEYTRFGLVFYL